MSQVSALEVRELTASIELLAGFESLRALPYPWLLDSGAASGDALGAQNPKVARYSFMGSDPYLVLRSKGQSNEIECRRPAGPWHSVGRQKVFGDPLEIMRSLSPPIPEVANAIPGLDHSPPFLGGAVGYLGYELGEVCEPVTLTGRDDFELPDLVLLFVDRLIVFDHATRRAFAVGVGFADTEQESGAREKAQQRAVAAAKSIELIVAGSGADSGVASGEAVPNSLDQRELLGSALPADARSGFDAWDYATAVDQIRDEIAAGNVYQANLTQRIDFPGPATDLATSAMSDAQLGWRLYRLLRELSPAPFAAYLELPEVTIASSSPERFLSLSREGRVESRPIKGTRRRGLSIEEDNLLAKELAASRKDCAENLMIVDLVRNDLGRVCKIGSVEVPELMAIERYATVFQMVSTVQGTLREDCDVGDLLRATFPPGSMTGAPKIAAMQLIDRIEPVRRGIYSGAIGYFDIAGGLDLSVVIRTLLVRNGALHLHSGGAVVSDSDPQGEYRESLDKVRALLAAIQIVS
jgi:para-aminobenzoate synthetase component 1